MSAETLQEVLSLVQAAGTACEIVCPGCKLLVDLGEAVAATLLSGQSTEAEQVADAEAAILAADSAVKGTVTSWQK